MHITHWNVVAVHGQGLFFLAEGRLIVVISILHGLTMPGSHCCIKKLLQYLTRYKWVYQALSLPSLLSDPSPRSINHHHISPITHFIKHIMHMPQFSQRLA